MDQMDDMMGSRREAQENHAIKELQEMGTKNCGTKLEELSLKALLINNPASTHVSDSLQNSQTGEKMAHGQGVS